MLTTDLTEKNIFSGAEEPDPEETENKQTEFNSTDEMEVSLSLEEQEALASAAVEEGTSNESKATSSSQNEEESLLAEEFLYSNKQKSLAENPWIRIAFTLGISGIGVLFVIGIISSFQNNPLQTKQPMDKEEVSRDTELVKLMEDRDRMKAQLALLDQESKPISEPTPNPLVPLPPPPQSHNPPVKIASPPPPTPVRTSFYSSPPPSPPSFQTRSQPPHPQIKNEDPIAKWEKLANLGRSKEVLIVSNPQLEEEVQSNRSEISSVETNQSQSGILSVRIGQPKPVNSLNSATNPLTVEIGSTVKGILKTPMFWNEEIGKDSNYPNIGQFALQLTEPLLANDRSTIVFPIGTILIGQTSLVNSNGSLQASAIAVAYQNGRQQNYQETIAPGHLLILAPNNQALIAKITKNSPPIITGQDILLGLLGAGKAGMAILNRPKEEIFDSNYGTNGSSSTYRKTTSNDPNLEAALLEGFFEQTSKRVENKIERRSQEGTSNTNQSKTYHIPANTPVSIYVSSFLEVYP